MPCLFFLVILFAGGGFYRRGSATGDPKEYIQVTRSLPADALIPACSTAVFSRSFANTSAQPTATASHSPPQECPGPWYAISLELSTSCNGSQRSRIAAVWLDGVELLRTSTPKPAEAGGFWVVRKDVTAYSAVFQQTNATLTVTLDNSVDEVYTGVYHLNITVLYYVGSIGTNSMDNAGKIGVDEGFVKLGKSNLYSSKEDEDENADMMNIVKKITVDGVGSEIDANRVSLSNKPADLIIPISSNGRDGFWFKIMNSSSVFTKTVEIPPNTYQAVLEIFVSFHSDDELWYTYPPDSYAGGHGKGAFRRVFATIDGMYVGSVVPSPIIYAEGVNPLFWQPIVGIGSLDFPSYKIEVTPFLGKLLDRKLHTVRIGVEDATQFWLVDANLHLWLDHKSDQVHAKLVQYISPALRVQRKYKVKQLINGKFKIQAQHTAQFSGWVFSSLGNLTTHVISELKFKNKIKINRQQNSKEAKQSISLSTEVRLESYSVRLSTRFNREINSFEWESWVQPGTDFTNRLNTKLFNVAADQSSVTLPGSLFSTSLRNEQQAEELKIVRDNSVLSVTTTTDQRYNYTENGCRYGRKAAASGGVLLSDIAADTCTTSLAVL